MAIVKKIFTVLLRWVAPLLVLGCATFFVYTMGAGERPKRNKPPVRKSIPVELIQARPHTGTLDIVASGVAIPYRDVQLSAKVSGEVVFKSDNLSPGRIVKAGEVVMRVDPQDYEIEVERLEQELAKADLNLERLQLDKENTQRLLTVSQDALQLRKNELRRLDKLRASNAASASELDKMEMELLTAIEQTTAQSNQMLTFDSDLKSLKNARTLAMLQLKRAQLDLNRTETKAPFTGVVIANHVEQNGMVQPGTEIATIEDTSRVEVRSSLRSEDLHFLQGTGYDLPQIPVSVEFDRAGKTFAWSGVLSRQDGLGLDQKTRTMPVRIRVDEPEKNIDSGSNDDSPSLTLLRGMFVRVRLHCEPSEKLVVIPESVIRPGKSIWVMKEGKLQIQHVHIARIEGGQAYVRMDAVFSGDEQVISSPVPNAKPGLAVSSIASGKNANELAAPKVAKDSLGSDQNPRKQIDREESSRNISAVGLGHSVQTRAVQTSAVQTSAIQTESVKP